MGSSPAKATKIMTKTWVISDTHFGHEKTCSVFKRNDGSPLRPFKDADEMDFEMIKRWNEIVDDGDRVYHLGDVVIARKNLWKISQLKGRKALVRGNHDLFKTKDYLDAGFDEIHGVVVLSDVILTHIPIHPDSLSRWAIGNIHGHLHANELEDKRYLCVSVEQTDYRPMLLDDARKLLIQRAPKSK